MCVHYVVCVSFACFFLRVSLRVSSAPCLVAGGSIIEPFNYTWEQFKW